MENPIKAMMARVSVLALPGSETRPDAAKLDVAPTVVETTEQDFQHYDWFEIDL